MNRRIDDLSIGAAQYADRYFDDNTDAWMHCYSDKFAELIVRECVYAIISRQELPIHERKLYSNVLKEHFGVE